MKALLSLITTLLLFFIFLYSNSLCGQTNLSLQETEFQENTDSTNKAILKELKIIRGLQQEAKVDRQKIKENIKRKEVELEEVPENEYGAILQVEHNTRPHWESDGWNLFGVITMVLAIFSLIICNFKSPKQNDIEFYIGEKHMKQYLTSLFMSYSGEGERMRKVEVFLDLYFKDRRESRSVLLYDK